MLLLVVLSLALLFVPPTLSDDKVVVGFYSEALCPGCLELSNVELTKAFMEVAKDISDGLINRAIITTFLQIIWKCL